ncbi:MAG: hypothetical protein V4547_13130 [Bacteroidota bacterium]
MKKIFLLSLLTLFCTFSFAQDTIIKSNGDQIFAKILEISTTEVKYKKFNFQEGPIYIESKSNIQLIKYSNGTKEEFQSQQTKTADIPVENSSDYYSGPVNTNNKIERYGNHFRYQGENISENELHDVLFKSKDKQIMSLTGNAKDAKKLQYIGFGAIPLGVGAFYFLARGLFGTSYYNQRPNSGYMTLSALCLAGAITCPITSGYFKHKRNTSNREAIKLYNTKF